MAEQAKVTSLDALEQFRAGLIVFLSKAYQAVDQVGDDVRRTRVWLQTEQGPHWQREGRKRLKQLNEAQTELFGARMSGLRSTTTLQEAAVRKAKAAVEEAEEKMRAVKKWNRDFDHEVEPLMKRLESLRTLLDHDLPKAVAFLLQAQRTLEAYADVSAPRTNPALPTPNTEP